MIQKQVWQVNFRVTQKYIPTWMISHHWIFAGRHSCNYIHWWKALTKSSAQLQTTVVANWKSRMGKIYSVHSVESKSKKTIAASFTWSSPPTRPSPCGASRPAPWCRTCCARWPGCRRWPPGSPVSPRHSASRQVVQFTNIEVKLSTGWSGCWWNEQKLLGRTCHVGMVNSTIFSLSVQHSGWSHTFSLNWRIWNNILQFSLFDVEFLSRLSKIFILSMRKKWVLPEACWEAPRRLQHTTQ